MTETAITAQKFMPLTDRRSSITLTDFNTQTALISLSRPGISVEFHVSTEELKKIGEDFYEFTSKL